MKAKMGLSEQVIANQVCGSKARFRRGSWIDIRKQ